MSWSGLPQFPRTLWKLRSRTRFAIQFVLTGAAVTATVAHVTYPWLVVGKPNNHTIGPFDEKVDIVTSTAATLLREGVRHIPYARARLRYVSSAYPLADYKVYGLTGRLLSEPHFWNQMDKCVNASNNRKGIDDMGRLDGSDTTRRFYCRAENGVYSLMVPDMMIQPVRNALAREAAAKAPHR